MELKRQLFFTALFCLTLDMTYAISSTWQAKLFSRTQQKGNFLYVSGNGGNSSSTCVNLSSRNICDSDYCLSATLATKSIDTMDTCVRLYSSDDCEGLPLMEISPGTICHSYWERCKLINTVRSIRGCSPVSNLSEHVQVTQRSMTTEEITSPNYPQHYRNDADLTWSIIAEPNRRINITFDDFKLENQAECKFDNLTIIDPINEQVLFMGCGDVLPSPIKVNSNQFIIRLKTDGSETQKGFALRWTSEVVPARKARAPLTTTEFTPTDIDTSEELDNMSFQTSMNFSDVAPSDIAMPEQLNDIVGLDDGSFHVSMDFSDVAPAMLQNRTSRLVCRFVEWDA